MRKSVFKVRIKVFFPVFAVVLMSMSVTNTSFATGRNLQPGMIEHAGKPIPTRGMPVAPNPGEIIIAQAQSLSTTQALEAEMARIKARASILEKAINRAKAGSANQVNSTSGATTKAKAQTRAKNRAKEQAEEEAIEAAMTEQKAIARARRMSSAKHLAEDRIDNTVRALASARGKRMALSNIKGKGSIEVRAAKMIEAQAAEQVKLAMQAQIKAQDAARAAKQEELKAIEQAAVADVTEAQAIEEAEEAEAAMIEQTNIAGQSEAKAEEQQIAIQKLPAQASKQVRPQPAVKRETGTRTKRTAKANARAKNIAREQAEEDALEAAIHEQKTIARAMRMASLKQLAMIRADDKVRMLAKATGRKKALSKVKGERSLEVRAAEMMESQAAEQVTLAMQALTKAQSAAKYAENAKVKAIEDSAVAAATEARAIEQAEEAEEAEASASANTRANRQALIVPDAKTVLNDDVTVTAAISKPDTKIANSPEFQFFVPGATPGSGQWFTAPLSIMKQAEKMGFSGLN